jgi:branched-chain amino acid transport system ATP-binding protein
LSALLDVRDVSAGYGTGTVLHGIDMTVDSGEVIVVLGPNGAGKTTLLRALSGVLPHLAGEVLFDGTDSARARPHALVKRGLVHVPEARGNVMPALTVAENLDLCGGANDEVDELFPILRERRRQLAGTLSGGQQQMLAIAMGLLLRPKVLLVDEPSAGLAPALVDEVFTRLASLRAHGLSLVLAEQRIDLALDIADRGYVLEAGRISASGSAEELRNSDALRGSYLGG